MRLLMGANMPAVLVEIGFLSNADDEKGVRNSRIPVGVNRERDRRAVGNAARAMSETPAPEKKAEARGLRVAIAAGVGLLLVGLWLVTLVPGWLSRDPNVSAPATPADTSSGRRIQATLFYVSDDGSDLMPVARDVSYGATPAEQAREILDGPGPPGARRLRLGDSGGTAIRSVFLGPKGELYVDLSPDGLVGHVSGSLDEALAVFAIVNAVTVNLPDVKAVQILVDGKEVDSLAGHIDLREPLGRADGWIRKGQ
jgi:hypothetical protein